MLSVVNNMTAMNAARQYGLNVSSKSKSSEKLSSGFQINRAADDAAGLTISEKMRYLIGGLNQGTKNIQDGISLVQIADGALAEVNDMLHRMTELSVKSANGTNTNEDRDAIQKEIAQIKMEIDRVADSTEFNTMPLFKDKNRLEDDGDITKFVECDSAQYGKLAEAYLSPTTGSYYPAAKLKFSGVKDNNVMQLANTEFSFVCSHGCGETFKFKFVTDGADRVVNSTSGRNLHEYYINISGLEGDTGASVGSQMVTKIQNILDQSSASNLYATEGAAAGHKNRVIADNDTLIIYDNSDESKFSSANAASHAARNLSGDMGSVNCTALTNLVVQKKNDFTIACSNGKNDEITIQIGRMNCTYIGIKDIDVSTENGARMAIDQITAATSRVSAMRSDLGAYQNRLEHAYNNNGNKAENTTAAESRIRDTDMAGEMVRLSMLNILDQVGTNMMAQANQSTQGVLALLGA